MNNIDTIQRAIADPMASIVSIEPGCNSANAKLAVARLANAFRYMQRNHVAYYAKALALRWIISYRFKTAATDGKCVWFNPDYMMNELTDVHAKGTGTTVGVAIHEVSHVSNLHHTRRKGRGIKPWNEAADFSINWQIIKDEIELPVNVLFDEQYADMSAEQVHRIRENEKRKDEREQREKDADEKQESGDDDSDDDSNDDSDDTGDDDSENEDNESGDNADDDSGDDTGDESGDADSDDTGDDETADDDTGDATGDDKGRSGVGDTYSDESGCGGVIDASTDESELRDIEADAIKQTMMADGIGRAIAGDESLAKSIEHIKGDSRDWRTIVSDWTDSDSNYDYSWNRFNRMHVHSGLYLPGIEPDCLNHLIYAVDESYSLNNDDLAIFGGHVADGITNGIASRFTIIYCSDSIHHVAEYSSGESAELVRHGTGGTSFRPVMEWIADNAPDASGLIYFTDLQCNEFGDAPDCPVLWVNTDANPYWENRVPFGDIVRFDPAE